MTRVLLVSGVAAFAAGFWSSLLVRHVARARGLVDRPGGRKAHEELVPLLGGVAVALGSLAGIAAAGGLAPDGAHPWPLLAGAAVALVVGVVDDLGQGLSSARKLAGQGLAALVAVAFARPVAITGVEGLDVALAFAGLVLAMNAFNLLDNMNGLCAGVGAACAAGLGMGWVAIGYAPRAVAPVALLGACAGFLPWNLPRARLFLGDAGSHWIGFKIGAIAFFPPAAGVGGVAHATLVACVLTVPLLDVTWVVRIRRREGRPIHVGDLEHLSHHLVRAGLAPVRAVWVLVALALVTASLGASGAAGAGPGAWALAWGVALAFACVLERRTRGRAPGARETP